MEQKHPLSVSFKFPFKIRSGPKPTILDPKMTNIIFTFIVGKGAIEYGICSGCEVFFDGTAVYKRVTFRDINSDSQRERGFSRVLDSKLHYYLIPTKIPTEIAQKIIDENKIEEIK